ncbi:hypothetical protein QHH03_29835, partial [Aphanizomenon sp. 202]|nr:hypothetical protein [Aphanizomenon sp. 202]
HVFKHEFFLFPVARSLFPLKNNDLLSRLALKIVVIARQEARGKRQEARGKSKEVFRDFTSLYTVWFYCVHLLNVSR